MLFLREKRNQNAHNFLNIICIRVAEIELEHMDAPESIYCFPLF